MRVLGKSALIHCFVCTSAACLLRAATLVASSPDQPPESSCRTITLAERVAHQYAVEEVYWRHRIWPNENRKRKPSLEAIISQHQIEQKVEGYLSKSQAVSAKRGWAISASELQAEMDRMAGHTHQAQVLRELFAALGNDPFVIAECLARPSVAERLFHGSPAVAGVSPGLTKLPAADTAASTTSTFTYRLPKILDDCTDDTWTTSTIMNAPDARRGHTAIWTGTEMIIWGGALNDNMWHFFNTGARYNPATDSWTPTSTTNAPIGRWLHTAVWTGIGMIVWGGGNNTDFLNTGASYDPTNDIWVALGTTNTPDARVHHSAIWTGTQMIVWGGTITRLSE